ncbi:hypothetical protein CQ057_16935 [Ochrobactrum sp. MYb49]|nr:hypothetical protein CQ057_16935 [Ochrobactrum sp. MYb49]
MFTLAAILIIIVLSPIVFFMFLYFIALIASMFSSGSYRDDAYKPYKELFTPKQAWTVILGIPVCLTLMAIIKVIFFGV